jgi:hypothetical protein
LAFFLLPPLHGPNSFIYNTCEADRIFAQFWGIPRALSYLESTLAKVQQNKPLYLSLE